MSNYRWLTTWLLVLLVTSLSPTYTSSALRVQSTGGGETSTISADIIFANYSDLDSDGHADDVYAEVEIYLGGGEAFTFEYLVTLTLPSGKSYDYQYIITTNYEHLIIRNFFYDHATESGWYQLDVAVTLNNGGRSTSSCTMIFDPPGGSSGSDPDLEISV